MVFKLNVAAALWVAAFAKGDHIYRQDTLLILRILDAIATIRNEPKLPTHPSEAAHDTALQSQQSSSDTLEQDFALPNVMELFGESESDDYSSDDDQSCLPDTEMQTVDELGASSSSETATTTFFEDEQFFESGCRQDSMPGLPSLPSSPVATSAAFYHEPQAFNNDFNALDNALETLPVSSSVLDQRGLSGESSKQHLPLPHLPPFVLAPDTSGAESDTETQRNTTDQIEFPMHLQKTEPIQRRVQRTTRTINAPSKTKRKTNTKSAKQLKTKQKQVAEEYVVERIIKHRGNIRKHTNVAYKVKWLGYNEESWVEEDDMVGCSAMISEYWAARS